MRSKLWGRSTAIRSHVRTLPRPRPPPLLRLLLLQAQRMAMMPKKKPISPFWPLLRQVGPGTGGGVGGVHVSTVGQVRRRPQRTFTPSCSIPHIISTTFTPMGAGTTALTTTLTTTIIHTRTMAVVVAVAGE